MGGEIIAATSVNQDVAQFWELETVFGNIVQAVLAFAGIVLFIMLLIGGFKYLTAGGDPKSVESAQKTLTYAVIGLVLIALAYLILKFISVFTGADVLNFVIFKP
jgi:hypothetical protein